MRWRQGRRSTNVEDRRGQGPSVGGMRVGPRTGIGGIGGIVLIIILLMLGVDPTALLTSGGSMQQSPGTQTFSPEEEELKEFVSVVLADTEDAWHGLFRDMGRQYREPKLVIYSGAVRSACGMGQSAMGPFYCPGDQKLYIDLSFYNDLKRRHNAPGDFAQAYVVAHEVGHHVQTILGIADQVRSAQQSAGKEEANRIQVMMELQADCFSGVWAKQADRARNIIEPGDIDEALNAAAAIGDDRLQRQAQGYVVPESFTHGTSAQRARWFKRGFQSGSPDSCDTFGASQL